MKKKTTSQSAFFNLRFLAGLIVVFTGGVLTQLGFGEFSNRIARANAIPKGPAPKWVWQKPLPQGNPLAGVSFADANNGTAVGQGPEALDGALIERTTDGGNTWVVQASGLKTATLLFGVWFTDANSGTAVGQNGTIIRTTDGGSNWIAQTSGTTADLNGVSFADANNGVAVGGSLDTGEGTILRTTDGGNNWVSQSPGISILTAVSLADADNGTAVGFGDTVLRTTDGGNTWSREHSGTAEGLWGVSFPDPDNGTAVGTFGAIVRRAAAPPTPTPTPSPRPTPTPRPRPSPPPRPTPPMASILSFPWRGVIYDSFLMSAASTR